MTAQIPTVAPRGPHVPFLLAAGFLSAIPIPIGGLATDEQLAASLRYFPLIGALLGGVIALVDLGARALWPVSVASILDLGVLALLTGGIHLDALMDTCDGVFGGRTVERRLEIMHDSRVGSFGVIGGALALLAQYAALSNIVVSLRPAALIGVLAVSRWGMVLAILAFPPARPDGLGARFRAQARPSALILATGFAVLAALPLTLRAIPLMAAAALATLLSGRFLRAQLGGLTGDSYGAIGEAVATSGLLVLAATLP